MAQTPSIDILLNLVPERPNVVLEKLQAHPTLAHRQDGHGYSLVHAAASYGHSDLLQALVKDFKVDPNIKDEDGETALFSVDGEAAVQITQQLLALGTDINHRNNEGQTAAEKLDDEDEQPMVAAYLRQILAGSGSAVTSEQNEAVTNGEQNGVHPPPPLPQGLELNVGTMMPSEAGEEPDPEFRRRIEELAARSDFETEAGQRDLRNLVSDALSGITNEGRGPPATRRRVD
ncbi:uncharacterized protein MYCFIDRAFT_27897 [Pseudocercospora fijiensis CIRAD86]|uniref:Uncharacterized protein n=1 Tax=Pseudocercospora fijiensis (strain CIRAD86) TaxID=383855 RepID=N1QAW5_PSEFD|nr:uncharacterized protein MYCFIDRAFT_27897 [Pseudocercospora fijiensis CIRAD86]EME88192.1 hypothetical protein MYCFIDRAFT_27897 [Pseudocercospora fijiensis CIRAD86]